jgi:hypothetical protein
LLNATGRVVAQATRIADEIRNGVKKSRKRLEQLRLEALQAELERMIPLVRQVMRQTKARLFRNDLHAVEKLVSLFETATQIVRKGKSSKPTEFGRLIKIQEAENQIITDYTVCDQRPGRFDIVNTVDRSSPAKTRPGAAHRGDGCSLLLCRQRNRGDSDGRKARGDSPIVQQKVRSVGRYRRNAGSDRRRLGGQGAKDGLVSSNAVMA